MRGLLSSAQSAFLGLLPGWGGAVDASPPTPPAAPTVTATPDYLRITLEWEAVEGADSYEAEIDAGAGYSPITVSGTSAAALGLEPGAEYGYRVRAVNSAGSSEWVSGLASALVIPVPEASINVGADNVSLTWSPSSPGIPTSPNATVTAHLEVQESGGDWTSQSGSSPFSGLVSSGYASIQYLTSGTNYDLRMRWEVTDNHSRFSSYLENSFTTAIPD